MIRSVTIRRFKRFEEIFFDLKPEEIHPEVIEKLDHMMEAFGL